jgi:hypothetical protein
VPGARPFLQRPVSIMVVPSCSGGEIEDLLISKWKRGGIMSKRTWTQISLGVRNIRDFDTDRYVQSRRISSIGCSRAI